MATSVRTVNRLAQWLLSLTGAITASACWQLMPGPSAAAVAIADEGSGAALAWQGVSSCTAAACHNAGGPHGAKRSEYSTWLDKDRHARAFAVLREERSQIIMRNYRGSSAGRTPRAEDDWTCLKCHGLAPELAGTGQAYLNQDGVSCESCHGRAEKWLSIHYLPDWKDKSDEQKIDYGMTPTKNLIYRAKQCATCHIGSPDNDLNHDLYAAGHPPLYYEYSAFLGSMPKHWNEREEKARYPDFEMRVWAIGQVASARDALRVLAHRAGNQGTPWPEFAEYGCFACHHDLQVGNRGQEAMALADRRPGKLPWESWFTSQLMNAVDGNIADGAIKQLEMELDALRKAMERPAPEKELVAAKAKHLVSRLDQALTRLNGARFDQAFIDRLSQSLSIKEQRRESTSWEESTQIYLALAALYHARADPHLDKARAPSKADLEARKKRLQFPGEFLSPRTDTKSSGSYRPDASH